VAASDLRGGGGRFSAVEGTGDLLVMFWKIQPFCGLGDGKQAEILKFYDQKSN